MEYIQEYLDKVYNTFCENIASNPLLQENSPTIQVWRKFAFNIIKYEYNAILNKIDIYNKCSCFTRSRVEKLITQHVHEFSVIIDKWLKCYEQMREAANVRKKPALSNDCSQSPRITVTRSIPPINHNSPLDATPALLADYSTKSVSPLILPEKNTSIPSISSLSSATAATATTTTTAITTKQQKNSPSSSPLTELKVSPKPSISISPACLHYIPNSATSKARSINFTDRACALLAAPSPILPMQGSSQQHKQSSLSPELGKSSVLPNLNTSDNIIEKNNTDTFSKALQCSEKQAFPNGTNTSSANFVEAKYTSCEAGISASYKSNTNSSASYKSNDGTHVVQSNKENFMGCAADIDLYGTTKNDFNTPMNINTVDSKSCFIKPTPNAIVSYTNRLTYTLPMENNTTRIITTPFESESFSNLQCSPKDADINFSYTDVNTGRTENTIILAPLKCEEVNFDDPLHTHTPNLFKDTQSEKTNLYAEVGAPEATSAESEVKQQLITKKPPETSSCEADVLLPRTPRTRFYETGRITPRRLRGVRPTAFTFPK